MFNLFLLLNPLHVNVFKLQSFDWIAVVFEHLRLDVHLCGRFLFGEFHFLYLARVLQIVDDLGCVIFDLAFHYTLEILAQGLLVRNYLIVCLLIVLKVLI